MKIRPDGRIITSDMTLLDVVLVRIKQIDKNLKEELGEDRFNDLRLVRKTMSEEQNKSNNGPDMEVI
jgi:hypothetical protein